jgi:DnaJ like chaperone protein
MPGLHGNNGRNFARFPLQTAIMSIWGKVAGAVAGVAIGGPLGALIGAVAGHLVVDKDWEGVDPDGSGAQVAFTIGFIALSAKMAKADGVVTRDEVDAFKQVFRVAANEYDHVKRVFDLARQDVAGYEAYAKQLGGIFRSRPGVLEDVLDALFHIAKADGVIHDKEIDYLENVAEIFGFSAHEFARIRASHLGPNAADPYVVLGVDRDISDEDLKRAYRRLVKENHPDSLIARGVPEEFVIMANEKLAAINSAFDQVEKERGL